MPVGDRGVLWRGPAAPDPLPGAGALVEAPETALLPLAGASDDVEVRPARPTPAPSARALTMTERNTRRLPIRPAFRSAPRVPPPAAVWSYAYHRDAPKRNAGTNGEARIGAAGATAGRSARTGAARRRRRAGGAGRSSCPGRAAPASAPATPSCEGWRRARGTSREGSPWPGR